MLYLCLISVKTPEANKGYLDSLNFRAPTNFCSFNFRVKISRTLHKKIKIKIKNHHRKKFKKSCEKSKN